MSVVPQSVALFNKRGLRIALIGWCVCAGLSGCVTRPQLITGGTAVSAEQLSDWRAAGRLGVSSTLQSGSGAFTWWQTPQRSEVSLRGPAGIGAMQVTLSDGQINLRSSDGQSYDAAAALAELQQRLGMALPLTELSYWLRGVAAPGDAHWNDAHDVLTQQGWRIAYSEWSERGALRLPVKLTVQRDELRIIAKIQQWQLSDQSTPP